MSLNQGKPFGDRVFNVFGIILLFIGCSAAEPSGDPKAAEEDLRFLFTELETYHPGLYRYTPKDSIMAILDDALDGIEGFDSLDVYRRASAMLSALGCGHTRIRMSEAMRRDFEQKQIFIPLSVKIFDGHFYVDESFRKRIPSGAEIHSINGQSIGTIQDRIYTHLSGDGWITTGKERRTEVMFDILYQLYVDPEASSYEVRYSYEGKPHAVTLGGVPLNVNERITDANEELLSMEVYDDYAYLRIKTFSQRALQNGGWDYESFLAQSFSRVKSEGVQHLILDLRGNGGGKDDFGALLVSYLAKDDFGYFERIEVTDDYPGTFNVVDDRNVITYHRGLSRWEPQSDRFDGSVYVLIDGFSFSTCADVATVLHHRKWATFIGQETGGGYDGNTSGHTRTTVLPNTGIRVSVPMWMYTTANVGHTFPGRGVVPDYPVPGSWSDFSQGRDSALEKALELINNR